jgi:hypothetical protein
MLCGKEKFDPEARPEQEFYLCWDCARFWLADYLRRVRMRIAASFRVIRRIALGSVDEGAPWASARSASRGGFVSDALARLPVAIWRPLSLITHTALATSPRYRAFRGESALGQNRCKKMPLLSMMAVVTLCRPWDWCRT